MTKPRRYDPQKTTGHFVLLGKLAVPEPDLMKWAHWFEYADRHVASTRIGPIWISTVFLGLDHSFNFENDPRILPVLFETMIFRGGSGDDSFRCGTWEEAEEQHREAVAMVRKEIKDKVND
jgi:hypothetical protein